MKLSRVTKIGTVRAKRLPEPRVPTGFDLIKAPLLHHAAKRGAVEARVHVLALELPQLSK